MNKTSTAVVSKNLRPINLLEQLFGSQGNGCLQVSNNSVFWSIYLENGKLTYATHSVEPFERLERCLKRLSRQIKTLTSEARTQLRLQFELEAPKNQTKNFDYEAICWLVEQKYISPTEAGALIERLTKEVIELFLSLQEGTSIFYAMRSDRPTFCHFERPSLIETCRNKLQSWQALGPEIWSPYQRPYLSPTATSTKLSSEQKRKLGGLLQGFNFYHLAVILNQDELKVAQTLHPLIVEGTVVLREPHSPFNQLPRFSNAPLNFLPNPEFNSLNNTGNTTFANVPEATLAKHTIACIDDSSTILNEIDRFLENRNFEVFTITDSIKALREIIRIKPDLILLDVGMPNVDGYKLCRLIRNHSSFKEIPIVMVTGNTGLIDRARAKLAGSTDYMTKPFTQADLLKMVFRYLS